MLVDDIALLSSTPAGLQNQLNILFNNFANRLSILVNLEKTKGSSLEEWGLPSKCKDDTMERVISVSSTHKHLGLNFKKTVYITASKTLSLRANRELKKSLRCCGMLDALTSMCFWKWSAHILYLCSTMNLICGVVLIV